MERILNLVNPQDKLSCGFVHGELRLFDKVTWETEEKGQLQTIYKDGQFENHTTLKEIKEKLI